MPPRHALNERFLRDNLSKYRHKDMVKRDVLTALATFTDLGLKREKHYSADGKCRDLVKLDGTIPVTYQGTKYHIPVAIWLDEAHPNIPPTCLVQPTSTMVVKPGRHVDANGRLYLPYLQEWNQTTSDLSGLIHVMCIVFGEQSPVFSRNAAQQPWPGSQAAAAGQPPPPRPQFSYAAQPPGSYPRQAMPTAQHQPLTQTQSQPVYPPGSYPRQQAPYPVQPMVSVPAQQWGQSAQPNRVLYPYPTHNSPQFPASAVRPPPGPLPMTTAATGTSYSPLTARSTNHLITGNLIGSVGSPPAPAPSSDSIKPSTSQMSVPEETVRASLVSAVEDRLRQRLKETFSTAEVELAQLRSTQEELHNGGSKLQTMIQQMQRTQAELEEHIKVLERKDSELQDVLRRLEDEPEVVNVDEAVTATTPLYKQILNLIAEDNAIEDTIYYLGEALRKNVITLDVFLKNVRELSRRQFVARALTSRAVHTAHIPS